MPKQGPRTPDSSQHRCFQLLVFVGEYANPIPNRERATRRPSPGFTCHRQPNGEMQQTPLSLFPLSTTPDITQKKHEETLKGGEDKPGWPATLGFKESHHVRSLSFCLMYPRLSVEEADNLEMLMDTHTHTHKGPYMYRSVISSLMLFKSNI